MKIVYSSGNLIVDEVGKIQLSENRIQLSPSALKGRSGIDIVRRRLTVTFSQQGLAGSGMYLSMGSSRPISPLSYKIPKATDKTVFVAE